MGESRGRQATERTGVHAVGKVIEGELGWIFREQPINDYGVDAHVEIFQEGQGPSGRLIGLQIKTGESYFEERSERGIVIRGEVRHFQYWERHSLPIVVIVHDPRTDFAYWQVANNDTIQVAGSQWKLEVPFSQRLGLEAQGRLSEIAEGPPYYRRLAHLSLAKPWMDLLSQGNRLLLEAEEWTNKSSGRGSLRLVSEDDSGDEVLVEDWPFVMFPGVPYVGVFESIFPWADLAVDDGFYEDYDEALYDLEEGHWDNEDQRYVAHGISFEEWRRKLARIRPYESNGEIARFRLEMTLNDLGAAFISLDRYLETGEVSRQPIEGEFGHGYQLGLKNVLQRGVSDNQ